MTKKDTTLIYHGGGYVGYTGAVFAAKQGFDVIIYDLDKNVVNQINNGEPPVYGLGDFIEDENIDINNVRATSDFNSIKDYKYHIFSLPTEKDGEPYFKILYSAIEKLLNETDKRIVLSIESTVHPNFSKELNRRFRKRYGNYDLIVAPRRDWFINKEMNVEVCERVIGVDGGDLQIAKDLYSNISKNIHWTDNETAELVKQLENAMLYNSVVFLMDFARAYSDKNAREIIRLACTHWRHPNYHISLGIGGYCVPLGMKYLNSGDFGSAGFLLSTERKFRREIVQLLKGKHFTSFLFLGVSDKTNFKIPHLSPSIDMSNWLGLERENTIAVHDQLMNKNELMNAGVQKRFVVNDINKVDIEKYDVVVINTLFEEYKKYADRISKTKMIIDNGLFEDDGEIQKMFQDNGSDYRLVGGKNWLN